MNLYETLELSDTASIDEIKKSYRRLAKKYHPDKNKNKDAIKKFIQINSAYEILSDEKSRKEYIKLDSDNKNDFSSFISKIFEVVESSVNCNEFSQSWEKTNENINHIIKLLLKPLPKSKVEYLTKNIGSILNNSTFNEVFDFFISGNIPNNNFDIDKKKAELSEISEQSEIEYWTEELGLYFDSLPLEFQNESFKKNKSSENLWISKTITIDQLFKNDTSELVIKRIGTEGINKTFTTKFRFDVKRKWIVFIGGGDQKNDLSFGNLIIKLNLDSDIEWQDNTLLHQKEINLYEFIYGINIDIEKEINQSYLKKLLKKSNIKIIKSWVPLREGNLIMLIKNQSFHFGIKLTVKINELESKRDAIKQFFDN